MNPAVRQLAEQFDLPGARRALLRYRPASNWLAMSQDPTQRMTVGYGFDVSRSEAPELLRQVGLDPAAVRGGRTPVSDAQMQELFDLTLLAAFDLAHRRVPGFARMPTEQQWALLELIVWLGREGTVAVLSELEQRSLPLAGEPPEASPWFDSRVKSRPLEPGDRFSKAGCQTTFESFGVVAELVSDDPALVEAARATLPPGWVAADGEPSVCFGVWTDGLVTVNDAQAAWVPDRAAALLRLGAVVRHHVATEAPSFTFVHAGVVEVGGFAIVIPGRTYTGKSTLVAELVRLGARYLSDEYAVIDGAGLVRPFAKPLSIRTGRTDPVVEHVPVARELVAGHPVRVGLIVLTSYAPGAEWNPSVRSTAQGALALLQNTVSARLRPDAALSATSRVARGTVFLAGQRGEARDTAKALLELALLRAESSNTFSP
jgi:hypothetical protein